MNQSKSDGARRNAPAIGLYMECEEDELSPAQIEFYEKSRKNYEKFMKQLDDYNKMKHGEVVTDDEGFTMIETLIESETPPVRNQQFTIIQLTGDNRAGQLPVVPNRPNILLPPKTKPLPTLRAKPAENDSPKAKLVKIRKDGKLMIASDSISEARCLGGLTFGDTEKKTTVPYSISDDGDVEIAISKAAGKTYPSLMCFAKPKLNPKVGNLSVNQSDRSVLDGQVKGLLMLPAPKFCEWLLQQGLVRKTQNCPIHKTSALQIVHNTSKHPNKLIFTGGLVRYGDCCKMKQLVSVFYGSIFESSPHPPSVILKLIYHWACQTNIPNVVQWVKVDTMYVRNFYSSLRAVCVLSMQTKFERFGGANKRIEVGSHHFRAKGEELIVFGILDPETKRIRLRAMHCGNGLVSEMAHFVTNNIKRNSIICCDHSMDASEIFKDFSHIDQHISSNKTIMTYLRETVAKFSPSNYPISRIIFQQFLDELTWRERWGPNSMSAFGSMVKHISDYTNENTEGGIIKQLIQIGNDPFTAYGTAPSTEVKMVTRKRAAVFENVVPVPKKQAKDTSGDKNFTQPLKLRPRHTDFWVLQDPDPDMTPEIMLYLKNSGHIPVDNYFYGTLPGKVISTQVAELTLKCTICQRVFFDCFNLMAHLVLHYQTVPAISGPLQRICQCLDCFVGFQNPNLLQSHLVLHSLGEHFKRRSCQICEMRFASRTEFVFHMLRHHVSKELPYRCDICSFRSSSYTNIITHMKTHQWDSYLFCPYCLKTVQITNGRHQQVHIAYFAAHIRRHFTMDEEYCLRCKLRFVHPSLLKLHVAKDHVSFEARQGLESFPNVSNCTIMPPPGQISIPPLRPYEKIHALPKMYRVFPFARSFKISGQRKCVECEGVISAKHFPGRVKCDFCSYETHCEQAAKEHYRLWHDEFHRPRVLFSKPVPSSDSMYCYCGYQSSGNDLAVHLVKCGEVTAYAKMPELGQAEESTLTVLNTVGLVRKSPEPVEKTMDEGIITQSSESFINIVSVESLSGVSPSKKRPDPAPSDGQVATAQGGTESGPSTAPEQECYIVDDETGAQQKTVESIESVEKEKAPARSGIVDVTAADSVEEVASSGAVTAKNVEEILSSGTETAVSIEEIVSSGTEAAVSVEEILSSGTEAAVSVEEIVSSGTETAASVEEIVSSGTETAASVEEIVSSGTETAASVEEIVSSGTETAASVEEIVGSGTKTSSSVEEIMSSDAAPVVSIEESLSCTSFGKLDEIPPTLLDVEMAVDEQAKIENIFVADTFEASKEMKKIEEDRDSSKVAEMMETDVGVEDELEPMNVSSCVEQVAAQAQVDEEVLLSVLGTETEREESEKADPNGLSAVFTDMETTEEFEVEPSPETTMAVSSSILTDTNFEEVEPCSMSTDSPVGEKIEPSISEMVVESVNQTELTASSLSETIDLIPTLDENVSSVTASEILDAITQPSEGKFEASGVGCEMSGSVPSPVMVLAEGEKIEEKVEGGLIEELENIMSAAEGTAISQDFTSE